MLYLTKPAGARRPKDAAIEPVDEVNAKVRCGHVTVARLLYTPSGIYYYYGGNRGQTASGHHRL
jgi:hypothetical protein